MPETIGERIKQRRMGLGLSQSELGRRLVAAGFTSQCQTYVHRSESGLRRIPVDEALAMAALLNVTIQWLATGSEDHVAGSDRYAIGYRDGIEAARDALDKLP